MNLPNAIVAVGLILGASICIATDHGDEAGWFVVIGFILWIFS